MVRKSGIKQSEVSEWLHQQNVYTLHKAIRKKFKRRRVYVSGVDDQWQADLVEMIKYKKYNDNIKYILTIIDVFSKYAWAIPIKVNWRDY